MPPPRRFSDQQLELIVQFMEEHREFATQKFVQKKIDKQKYLGLWGHLANVLNQHSGGAVKSARKWRDFWHDKKYKVRKKALDLQQRGTNDGDPGAGSSLDQWEQRILAIIGDEAQENDSTANPLQNRKLSYVSYDQLELMVQFMEEHREFAANKLVQSPQERQKHFALWGHLASRLNAGDDGAIKSATKWRDFWHDKKCKVRNKVRKKAIEGDGPGAVLEPMDQRILAIIGGEAAVNGCETLQPPLHKSTDSAEHENYEDESISQHDPFATDWSSVKTETHTTNSNESDTVNEIETHRNIIRETEHTTKRQRESESQTKKRLKKSESQDSNNTPENELEIDTDKEKETPFDVFAKYVAMQLKTLSLENALVAQQRIQAVLTEIGIADIREKNGNSSARSEIVMDPLKSEYSDSD